MCAQYGNSNVRVVPEIGRGGDSLGVPGVGAAHSTQKLHSGEFTVFVLFSALLQTSVVLLMLFLSPPDDGSAARFLNAACHSCSSRWLRGVLVL